MVIRKIKQTSSKLFIISYSENIRVGDYVKFNYKGKWYAFEVIEVTVISFGYEFIAEEARYFAQNISNSKEIELIDLIDLELYRVTDKEEIDKIRK